MNEQKSQAQVSKSNQDHSALVVCIMREILKTKMSKFVNKNDLWAMCRNQLDQGDFNVTLTSLENDGTIYTAHDSETYCLSDE